MLKYFISPVCFLMVFLCSAQSKPIDLNAKDTTVYKQSYGLRIGIDLSRPIIAQLDENYSGLELVADYRLSQKLYIAAEFGNEEKTKQEDLFNFTTTGSYIKIGVDRNTYANWYGEQNLIFYGGRFAYSSFTNTLNNYRYFNSNRYWNPNNFTSSTTTNEEFSGQSAFWIEGVFGTKVELFKNLFMGASVRLGILLSQKEDERFPNLWVPGFNKVTDNSRFGVGYNYSISYLIPIYKKKNPPKTEKIEEN